MPEEPKKPPQLELVSTDYLKSMVDSREGSGFVTMLYPIELLMSRDALDVQTRRSLEELQTVRVDNKTPEEAQVVLRAVQQRIDFLSWLSSQPEELLIALYPAGMDGLDDIEEIDDLFGDDDDLTDLPF